MLRKCSNKAYTNILNHTIKSNTHTCEHTHTNRPLYRTLSITFGPWLLMPLYACHIRGRTYICIHPLSNHGLRRARASVLSSTHFWQQIADVSIRSAQSTQYVRFVHCMLRRVNPNTRWRGADDDDADDCVEQRKTGWMCILCGYCASQIKLFMDLPL